MIVELKIENDEHSDTDIHIIACCKTCGQLIDTDSSIESMAITIKIHMRMHDLI